MKHPDTQINILQFGQRVMVDGTLAYTVKHISSSNREDIYCAAFPVKAPSVGLSDYGELLRVISSADIRLVSPPFNPPKNFGEDTRLGDILTTAYNGKLLALGPTFIGGELGTKGIICPVVSEKGEIFMRPQSIGI